MSSFYSEEELKKIGFKAVGKNVLISRKASIYNAAAIELGDNVRIDDFCILSGKIRIGNFIHIGAFCGFYAGDAGIEMEDFSGTSPGVMIFATSDDFSGNSIVGPMVPQSYRKLISGKIVLQKYSQIGARSVILPQVIVKEGSAIGSMSLVLKSTEEWSIYFGNPAKKIKNRSKKVLELEKKFLEELNNERNKNN